MVIYKDNFVEGGLIDVLTNEIAWDDVQYTRRECFMSDEKREYQYIENGPIYESIPFHPLVKEIMEKINDEYGYKLDVCFLNYYADKSKALGWHADDSHPIDQTQPIAVVSFGQEREIWWKPMDYKGTIPEEWKQLLGDGSIFIMEAGMQDTHKHRIPKGDREMKPRISLTFRCWLKNK